MKLLILTMLLATTTAAPAAQSLTFHDDGSYRFYYETGKEGGSHMRSEVRNPDGVVIGKFSYADPDGDIREVNYRADEAGFVAQGDVGVKGAPKGQFPAVQEDQKPPVSESSAPSATDVDNQPPESKQNDAQQSQQSEPLVEASHGNPYHYEEEDKDEMQDLALEESSSDDPPEAFPPGFFLQKFHGLRRLPEPTKEDQPATTESPREDDEKQEQPETDKDGSEEAGEKKEPQGPTAPGNAPVDGSVFSFGPMKPPFPVPAIPHQEWASAMFHQPVYVFSYHQPDSYGYHYYF